MKAESSTLLSEFEDLGYELSDPQVIDGLCALCDIYNLSEEHLSCLYLTYSSETPNSKEELSAFENQILVPLKSQSGNKGKSKHLHDANSIKKLQARQIQAEGENDNLIALSYGQSAKDENKPRMEPRPSSIPEIQSPFRQRSNAGETLTKFGVPGGGSKGSGTIDLGSPEILGAHLSRPYSYMFERLREAAGVLDEILCRQSDTLMEKYPKDLEGGLEGDISIVNTEPFSAFGRICCEESEGKLNSRSVLLQGSMDASGGRSLLMEVNHLKEYSIFPGQILGFKGTNPHGGKLVAENIITDGSPPVRKDVKKNRREFSLIVTSGPYTTKDDLNFAPLKELLKQIRNSKPEYVILCGPYLDEKHPLLSGMDKENDSKMKENNDDEEESYDSMFAHRVIKPITDTLNECPHTRIIMLPSSRDIHHIPIYPTPPFDSSLNNDRIHMLSDPCLFSLEGIVFGVTSTDILFHLTKNEISNPGRNQDRLKRLSRHLLQQRSFYPMYPPNSDVNMDIEKCEAHSRIDVKPDVLILPSDLMHFIKDVDGTLVVNPSRLSRGTGGGVYSKINISNKGEEFLKNVFANIVRI